MSYRGEKWNKECDVVLDDDRISISSLPLLSSAISEAERNIQAPRGLLLNAALTAASIALGFSLTSPTPILITTFSSLGTSIVLLYLNFACNAGTTSFLYFSFNLFIYS